MAMEFVTLTPENLETEHLCCIIRAKKAHPGVEAKRRWLAARLAEGHVLRKLKGKECAFIEYAPLETAWTPVVGENYLYIYCLWVTGSPKGSGVGRALMEGCIADARAKNDDLLFLGGQRQRYNYFGFEQAGMALSCSVGANNVRHALKNVSVSLKSVCPR